MSGPSQRATGPSGQPKKKTSSIDLSTARQMLPLVESIVRDIVDTRKQLSHLSGEQDTLVSLGKGVEVIVGNNATGIRPVTEKLK